MIRRVWLLLLWVAVSGQASAAFAQGTQPATTVAAACIDLSRSMQVLDNSDGSLKFGDVLREPHRSRFAPGTVNLGPAVADKWLRLRLDEIPAGDSVWWLDTGNRTLQHIILFLPDGKGSWSRSEAGSWQRFSERPLPTSTLVFPLPASVAIGDIYLHISSNAIFSGAVQPRLCLAPTYREEERRELLLWTALMGVLITLALINAFLYWVNRHLATLAYVVHVVCTMLALSFGTGGYGGAFELFLADLPRVWQLTWVSSIVFHLLGASFFIAVFLGLKHRQPRLAKTLKWVMAIYAGASVAQFVMMAISQGSPSASALLPLVFAINSTLYGSLLTVIIVSTSRALRRGERGAYFIAAAFLPLFAMGFSSLFRAQGSALDFEMLMVGFVIEVVVMSMALVDQYRQLSAERAAARQEVLEQVRRSERELEAKVKDRTAELKEEQARSQELLRNILPDHIASELADKGSASPADHRSATILFTDLVGFTQTASTMPADRVVSELHDIFVAFDEITREEGVEKIKSIGDSYMAAAGLTGGQADHAHRCVRAALRMQSYMSERAERASFKWTLRIGLHSGPVVSGVVGLRKYAFDIWGDAVNLASRMESAGEPGKVNLSAYTHDLVKDAFVCTYRGKLPVKGKGELDMYFAEGPVVA